MNIIEHYGLQPKICTRPQSLGNLLESSEIADGEVHAFILDMIISNVKDLSELGLPEIQASLTVGVTVAAK
ncbi:MAG TPA: hypothetical protein VEK31_10475, partial [Xanthobacteraceae bacterium]|nr:hypothetical protein [Xanthobacteraceae bacterium]